MTKNMQFGAKYSKYDSLVDSPDWSPVIFTEAEPEEADLQLA